MAFLEFTKNGSDDVRVRAYQFRGHDLVDIRIFSSYKKGEPHHTQKGLSINVDQVPDLIRALEWALQQPCEDPEIQEGRSAIEPERAHALANKAHQILGKAGTALHWDMLENMIHQEATSDMSFDKWHLHYVLAKRSDLFITKGQGVFAVANPPLGTL